MRQWDGSEDALEAVLDDERARYQHAVQHDEMNVRVLWAGEAVELIDDIRPTTDVVRSIYDDALSVSGSADAAM